MASATPDLKLKSKLKQWRQETQLSLTNRATHLYKCNGAADLLKHAPPMCVTLPNLGVLQQRVYTQWLKWFCEAGGSPDEARLEQTSYPFQPH